MPMGKLRHNPLLGCAILVSLCISTISNLSLTILHTNDIHSRVEEMDQYGSMCKESDRAADKCFGGIARIASKLLEIRNRNRNVILLDGGDQQTGTLWYDVFKGNATAYFFNKLRYDAMVRNYFLLLLLFIEGATVNPQSFRPEAPLE